jgi:hypothetical protein
MYYSRDLHVSYYLTFATNMKAKQAIIRLWNRLSSDSSKERFMFLFLETVTVT